MAEVIANEKIRSLARLARIPLPLGDLQRNLNETARASAERESAAAMTRAAIITAGATATAAAAATATNSVAPINTAPAITTASADIAAPALVAALLPLKTSPAVLRGLSPIVPTFFIAICSLPGSNIAVPGAVAGPSYLLLVQALPPLAASTSSFRIRHSQQVSAIEQTFRNDNHVVVSWNGSPNFVIASTSQTLPGRYKIIVTPGH